MNSDVQGATYGAAATTVAPVSAVAQPSPPARRASPGALRATALALAGWAALILLARAIGRGLYEDDPRILLGNAPLVGKADLHPEAWILPAVAFALAALAHGPVLAARLRLPRLLAAAYGAALAWPALLALGDGPDAISAPLATDYEYLAAVDRVGSPGAFLSSFAERLPEYPTHVKGHPPGMVLILWALDGIGLGGATAAAVLVLAVGALAAPAVLLALRDVAGEQAMRRAAPFVALLPGSVWIGTSADALFMGAGACAAALVVVATGRRDRTGDLLAIGGGLGFGALLMLTYGGVLLGTVPLAVALLRRRVRPLLLAAAAAAVVLLAFLAAGFWWLDGLAATREQYELGVSQRRPYGAFLLISLAAFALATGPAAAGALARLRGSVTWALPGGALLAVAVADLSGMSRGETERIWLLFAPWLLTAAVAFPRARPWLAAQLALALALQVGTRSPW